MPRFVSCAKQAGFTLIELVIGIIAFAIVITLITGLIVPQATRSIDPIYQVRATELAQSLMNEITGKAFDEASTLSVGSFIRCDENVGARLGVTGVNTPPQMSCTMPDELGPDPINPNNSGIREQRINYDDVDDFDNLDQSGSDIVNSLGQSLEIGELNLYEGFRIQANVFYDTDFNGVADDANNPNRNTKLINITVTTPSNEVLQFSSYRTNF